MDQASIDDLGRSGLLPEDIAATQATASNLAAIKVSIETKGYVIPYYDLQGTRLPFYRVRLFDHFMDNKQVKYKQPFGTGNHIYFPRDFSRIFTHINTNHEFSRPFVIITEGEKKAAAVTKAGLPCVALGGVDNWKNKTIILPSDVKFDKSYEKMGQIRVKLPTGTVIGEDATLAVGLQGLIDFCAAHNADIIIAYDTDSAAGMKFEVQRAASGLANQLLHMGLSTSTIRQLVLPFNGNKVGLDDYIESEGTDALKTLIRGVLDARIAFPKHPNPRALISSKLQFGKLDRKEIQEVSLSILADLDSRGRRLRSENDGTPYYFDDQTYSLMNASLLNKSGEVQHESLFGTFLYRHYGISAADGKLMQWLAAQFTGEQPIANVSPKRVISLAGKNGGEIAVQISDSHFVVVTADTTQPIRVMTNGSYGILFEQDQVSPIDPTELQVAFEKQLHEPLRPWWFEVFSNNVQLNGGEETAKLISLLYYISPFLLRWRGTQLPVELLIGEPGSGKSSLYELRLGILTGDPKLRNIPTDLRDWFASIVNTGGLHVIDNVQFTNKELRQRMSDEICRIITEPNPHIEMRKLYTTSGQNSFPVNTVFSMTAIQQPFYNNDIIQRGAIFEMSAVKGGHTSTWVQDRINEYGGRISWFAHHLLVLHKFLVRANTNAWSSNYRASHRLANYEQCLQICADVFGMESSWIASMLAARTQRSMADADWTLEAIKEYIEEHKKLYPKGHEFSATQVSQWSEGHEEHHTNSQLTNARSLGRYMVTNKSILEKITGMKDQGTKANKRVFYIGPVKEKADRP